MASEWDGLGVEHYVPLAQIGEGAYGLVFLARDSRDGSLVAVKRINLCHNIYGVPLTAIREVKILRHYKHPNLVELRDIRTPGADAVVDARGSRSYLYLVFEYVDYDLGGLLALVREGRLPLFEEVRVKCYTRQLLEALRYLHAMDVAHRDLKCSNLLITRDNRLKLADFGLAREHVTEGVRDFTNHVITLWYRPPELLLGATRYGPGVDMWGVGCILAELLLGRPLFKGTDELDQAQRIFRICGTPTEQDWPGFGYPASLHPAQSLPASASSDRSLTPLLPAPLRLSPGCPRLCPATRSPACSGRTSRRRPPSRAAPWPPRLWT